MSIQYTAPEFKPTTFRTRVVAHNHYTRALVQFLICYLPPLQKCFFSLAVSSSSQGKCFCFLESTSKDANGLISQINDLNEIGTNERIEPVKKVDKKS